MTLAHIPWFSVWVVMELIMVAACAVHAHARIDKLRREVDQLRKP